MRCIFIFKKEMHATQLNRLPGIVGAILRGIAILTIIYFVGEWCSRWIPFPVPGAVIGMVLIFLLMQARLIPAKWVEPGATWLLSFLGLFYVPYGVGIVESSALMVSWGWSILVITLATVLTVFVITGRIFPFLVSQMPSRNG